MRYSNLKSVRRLSSGRGIFRNIKSVTYLKCASSKLGLCRRLPEVWGPGIRCGLGGGAASTGTERHAGPLHFRILPPPVWRPPEISTVSPIPVNLPPHHQCFFSKIIFSTLFRGFKFFNQIFPDFLNFNLFIILSDLKKKIKIHYNFLNVSGRI